MSVDLHIHSSCSDGTLTPEEIVTEALRLGLTAIAIADHDSVEAIGRARVAAEGTDLALLPAVEISTDAPNTEVHILGYYMDCADRELLGLLGRIREGRQLRLRRMVDQLNAAGVPLSLEEVLAQTSGEAVGRPHVAAALLARGHVTSQQEAFERYLRRGQAGYVPRHKLTPEEAVARIRAAGGLAVLAHPGLVNRDSIIDALLPHGLEGLEAYHTAHTPAQTTKYLQMARQRGLVVTGGTDTHGPTGPHPVAMGGLEVPDDCARQVQQWARTHGRL